MFTRRRSRSVVIWTPCPFSGVAPFLQKGQVEHPARRSRPRVNCGILNMASDFEQTKAAGQEKGARLIDNQFPRTQGDRRYRAHDPSRSEHRGFLTEANEVNEGAASLPSFPWCKGQLMRAARSRPGHDGANRYFA